jgi:hypothetical protein
MLSMTKILGLTLVVTVFAFAACTSESTSTSSSSSGGPDASTTGDSSANPAVDASDNGDSSTTNDGGDAGGTCGTVANSGTAVSETVGGGTKPTPAGGALYDGTFVLTKHDVFPPSSPDAHVRKRTWRFSGSSFEYVEEDDTDPVQRISGTVSANGTMLSLSSDCPTTNSASVPDTLTATEFIMFDRQNQDDVFTYTKQ